MTLALANGCKVREDRKEERKEVNQVTPGCGGGKGKKKSVQ